MKQTLLAVALVLLAFQAGRWIERAVWPCQLRPVAAVVAPFIGQQIPSEQVCDLLLKIPRF